MKDLLPVNVECHSGYKGDEYPICFYLHNLRFEIREFIDRWYQFNHQTNSPPANYYKVRTTDNKIYILKKNTENHKWFLWLKGESINLGM